MKKLLLVVMLLCSFAFGSTPFTANLQDVDGTTNAAGVKIRAHIYTMQNSVATEGCPKGDLPHVVATGKVIRDKFFDYIPNATTGIATGTILGNDEITCDVIGTTFYRFGIVVNGQERAYGDYTISSTGGSFNLGSATPMFLYSTSPLPFNALVSNPAGSQTLINPSGASFNITGLFGGTGLQVGTVAAPLIDNFYGRARVFGSNAPTSAGYGGYTCWEYASTLDANCPGLVAQSPLHSSNNFARGWIGFDAVWEPFDTTWKVSTGGLGSNDYQGVLFDNSGVMRFVVSSSTGATPLSLTYAQLAANARMVITPTGVRVGCNIVASNPFEVCSTDGTRRFYIDATGRAFLAGPSWNGDGVSTVIQSINGMSFSGTNPSISGLQTLTLTSTGVAQAGTFKGGIGTGAILLQDGDGDQVYRGIGNFATGTWADAVIGADFAQFGGTNSKLIFSASSGGQFARLFISSTATQIGTGSYTSQPAPTAGNVLEVFNGASNMFAVNASGVSLPAAGLAVSGTNFAARTIVFNSSYWTGTAANTDQWSFTAAPGAGTNPSVNLSLTHTGTTATSVFSIASGLQVITPTLATSGSNSNSPLSTFIGRYWDGTASQADIWQWQDILGSGSNPTSTATLSHSGSTGAVAVSLPALITPSLTLNGTLYSLVPNEVKTFATGTLTAAVTNVAIPSFTAVVGGTYRVINTVRMTVVATAGTITPNCGIVGNTQSGGNATATSLVGFASCNQTVIVQSGDSLSYGYTFNSVTGTPSYIGTVTVERLL